VDGRVVSEARGGEQLTRVLGLVLSEPPGDPVDHAGVVGAMADERRGEVVPAAHRDVEVGGASLVLDEAEGEGPVLEVVVARLVFQGLASLSLRVDLVLQLFDAVAEGGGFGLVGEVRHVDCGAQSNGDVAEGVVGDLLVCGEGGEDGVGRESASRHFDVSGGTTRVSIRGVVDVGEVVGALGLDRDGGSGAGHIELEEGDERVEMVFKPRVWEVVEVSRWEE
jgi:hypothetical protein